MAEDESLVLRRPKRSTAGNRMEMALAELVLEEPQEVEEDVDFVVDKEEEDIFESDFASTDDEAAQEDVDEGDKVVLDEERRERKTARARVEKATAAAHARQRVTFNPEASFSQPKSKPKPKLKRRVSLGVAVNAETGEVIEGSISGMGTVGVKRQSQRRHTVMNTSATVNRMRDAEEKRAAIPKKAKTITRLPTQDELIKRALDAEEGNIIEHRDYLRLEEEKRAKARVVRQTIEGPVLRWISKKETIQVEVPLPPAPPPAPSTTTMSGTQLYAAKYSFVYTPGVVPGASGTQAYSMPFYVYTPPAAQSAISKAQEASSSGKLGDSSGSSQPPPPVEPSVTPATGPTGSSAGPPPPVNPLPPSLSTTSTTASVPTASTSVIPSVLPVPPQLQPQAQPLSQPRAPAQLQLQPPVQQPSQSQSQPQPQPQSQPPVFFSYPTAPNARPTAYRPEDVCKNYVIHELSQSVPSKPPWKDTMRAMFGDHVKWEDLKVFTGKGRPLARPVRTCPITGQPAKYRDPRTNVPFASVGAYQVLTQVLGREYVWCNVLGCYVGVNERSGRGGGVGTSGSVEGAYRDRDDEDLEGPIAKRRKVGVEGG